MYFASSINHVETNKNACFTIDKNKYLTNQSLKHYASITQIAPNQAALLNMKKLHNNLKANHLTKFRRKNNSLQVKSQQLFVDLGKNAKDPIVDMVIPKDKVKLNPIL